LSWGGSQVEVAHSRQQLLVDIGLKAPAKQQ
jgi:hypothetical protein